MNQVEAAFIHSPRLDEIGYPPDCPFNSHRAGMTRKKIVSMGLLNGKSRREFPPRPATRSELEMFHTPKYIDAIINAEAGDLSLAALAMGLGTLENPIFTGLFEYATLACGATLTGARLILEQKTRVAFNPSGGYHHAGPEKASGFCYFNDVAMAGIMFSEASRRVLVLDLDVHHGDGVQKAFFNRKDIMTVSLHESGKSLFPGTGFLDEIGNGPGEGYALNIPLPEGTYDGAYLRIFREAVFPVLKKFNPDVMILELGMDSLSNDPMAHLSLTNNAHAAIIHALMDLGKPILATGGGGYNIDNTVRGWTLAWSILSGQDEEDLNVGMGGVMLENLDWVGGLRDRVVPPNQKLKKFIDSEINGTIKKIKETFFPYHDIN